MRTSVVTTLLILATLAEELVGHWRCTTDELVLDYVINRDAAIFKGSLKSDGSRIVLSLV